MTSTMTNAGNKRKSRRGVKLLLFAIAWALVPGSGLPGTNARAETYIELDEAGSVNVNPSGSAEITGTIAIKAPETTYEIYAFRVVDVTYDEESDRYQASWAAIPAGYNQDMVWISDFMEENYPVYDTPEKLVGESPVQQAAVFSDMQLWLLGGENADGEYVEGHLSQEADTENGLLIEYPAYSDGAEDLIGRSKLKLAYSCKDAGANPDHIFTFTELPVGQYLFCLDQGAHAPVTARLLPTHNANGLWSLSHIQASVKYGLSGIAKSVSRDQVAAGDTVSFTVDADVPDYTWYNGGANENEGEEVHPLAPGQAVFLLEDTMTSAFSLEEASVKLQGRGSAYDYQTLPADCYSCIIAELEDGKGTLLRLEFDYTKLHAAGCTNVRLTYDAAVTKEIAAGSDGNTNTAKLTYVKNIEGDLQSVEDSVTVWTYGVHIIKVDGDTLEADGTPGENTRYLAGASFVLYRRIGVYTSIEGAGAEDYIQAVSQHAKEGALHTIPVYRPDGTAAEGYELYLEYGDTLVSAADAEGVYLGGLGPGVYLLEETLAPEGYNLLKEGLRFEIQEKSLEEGEAYGHRPSQLSFTGDDGKSHIGYYDLLVRNYKGLTLPDAGGGGTGAFTAAGLLLMAAALRKAIKIHAAGKLSAQDAKQQRFT